MMRFRTSCPFSVWVAESSIPQLSSPIILRGGRLTMATSVLPTSCSGIHKWYEPEDLVGKTLIAIVNLPPRKMMGLESNGMLISAVHTEHGEECLHLIMVDDSIPAGAKLC